MGFEELLPGLFRALEERGVSRRVTTVLAWMVVAGVAALTLSLVWDFSSKVVASVSGLLPRVGNVSPTVLSNVAVGILIGLLMIPFAVLARRANRVTRIRQDERDARLVSQISVLLRQYVGDMKEEGSTSPTNANPTNPQRTLTLDEITALGAFTRALKAAAERLFDNAQSSCKTSLWSLYSDICAEQPIKRKIDTDGLVSQVHRFFDYEFVSFSMRVTAYKNRVDAVGQPSTLTELDIRAFCVDLGELVWNYRRLTREAIDFFEELGKHGVEPIWEKAPWSVRIHREFADTYDSLMERVVGLRKDTPDNLVSSLPRENDQLTKY